MNGPNGPTTLIDGNLPAQESGQAKPTALPKVLPATLFPPWQTKVNFHIPDSVTPPPVIMPLSPRASKKSFASVLAGEDVPIIPASRKPEKYNGFPAVSFFESEIDKLIEPFQFTVIGKFALVPSMQRLKNAFSTLKLTGTYQLSWMDSKHVLIKLSNEYDYKYVWDHDDWRFCGRKMRVFKWTPDFVPEKESSIVPVWVTLPSLPVHLYNKSALWLIAKSLGKPIQTDEGTANGTRSSKARVLIEWDCLETPPEKFFLLKRDAKGDVTKGIWQDVIFDNLPNYCTRCFHLGHKNELCLDNKSEQDKRMVAERRKKAILAQPRDFRNNGVKNISERNEEQKNRGTFLPHPEIKEQNQAKKKVNHQEFREVKSRRNRFEMSEKGNQIMKTNKKIDTGVPIANAYNHLQSLDEGNEEGNTQDARENCGKNDSDEQLGGNTVIREKKYKKLKEGDKEVNNVVDIDCQSMGFQNMENSSREKKKRANHL